MISYTHVIIKAYRNTDNEIKFDNLTRGKLGKSLDFVILSKTKISEIKRYIRLFIPNARIR